MAFASAFPAVRARPARGLPRRSRRGFGLWDSILAAGVIAVLAVWAGQLVGAWAEGRVVAGEARTVADLARAGRLLVEGDVAHAGRTHGVNAAPLAVQLADLEAADLRAPALGGRTPARRTLTLWLWRPAASTLVVIARARGEVPLARLPGAEDGVTGVGALLGADTRLRGPGLDFDMAPVNARSAGFATANDVFGLDHVALDVTCRSYLYRVEVDCDGDGTITPADALANTMETAIEMGDNDILGAGNVTAATAAIGRLEGATEIAGALTVDGELSVDGATAMEDLAVSGALTAADADFSGTLTVPDLVASGAVSGADLTIGSTPAGCVAGSPGCVQGRITVSGTARLGDADVDTLNVETLNVRQLSSDRADITDILADNVRATACTGCGP